MCIIIAKEIGKNLPNKSLLKKCWEKNKDGAGIMFNHNNKIIIKKGFMSFEKFYKEFLNIDEIYNLKEKGLVIHFRISTSGLVDEGNCHPYPLTNVDEYLRKTNLKCDIGIAHNGVIIEYNRMDKILNDTQLFIKNFVFDIMSNTKKDYYKSLVFKKMIEKMIDASRLVMMNGEGNIYFFGTWLKENGLYFSNNGYKNIKSKKFKLFDNEQKYFDENENNFYLDNDVIEEDEFNLYLDTLIPLKCYEKVYSEDFWCEYDGSRGNYFLNEEEQLIYELLNENKLCFLGDYQTKDDFYNTIQ